MSDAFASGYMPIGSAPKNGTLIELLNHAYGDSRKMRWCAETPNRLPRNVGIGKRQIRSRERQPYDVETGDVSVGRLNYRRFA